MTDLKQVPLGLCNHTPELDMMPTAFWVRLLNRGLRGESLKQTFVHHTTLWVKLLSQRLEVSAHKQYPFLEMGSPQDTVLSNIPSSSSSQSYSHGIHQEIAPDSGNLGNRGIGSSFEHQVPLHVETFKVRTICQVDQQASLSMTALTQV